MDLSKVPAPPPGMGPNHPLSTIYNPDIAILLRLKQELSKMNEENPRYRGLKQHISSLSSKINRTNKNTKASGGGIRKLNRKKKKEKRYTKKKRNTRKKYTKKRHNKKRNTKKKYTIKRY